VSDGALLSPTISSPGCATRGRAAIHDQHPFHQLMHAGKLTRDELATWTLNRYYYQTRIPIKDAIIVSKSEDPAFRRAWIRRVHDHDGDVEHPGRGAGAVAAAGRGGRTGSRRGRELPRVLTGVRFACDSYVSLCRESPLVVAVASSLTEMFAPDLMSARIAAWEKHYPGWAARRWRTSGRACRARGATARRGWRSSSRTRPRGRYKIRAWRRWCARQRSCGIWRLRAGGAGATSASAMIEANKRVRLVAKVRLQRDRVSGKPFLLYPERGLELSDSAARIVALCGEDRTVAAIVDELTAASGEPRERIETEVISFLRALDDRGLLVVT
jgi:coenzyme PQQ biosynthesis protein C/coenzyme PQQ biosynthesis protein PqqD